MKALTVRQPWASLIIVGEKDIENRGWRTHYRGKLAIHAAMAVDNAGVAKHEGLREMLDLTPDRLPCGRVLGTVTLVDCIEDSASSWAEPGSWHWTLTNAHAFAHPVPAKGRLGLWEWDRTPKEPWKSAASTPGSRM